MYFNKGASAQGEEKNLTTGLSIGIYEKGPYMGIYSNLTERDQLELGINYFNVPIGSYDAGFSEKINANLSFTGVKLLYKKYIKDSFTKSGPYAELGLEINRISAYSNIRLSELSYKLGNVTIYCPDCDDIDFKVRPKVLNLIPSLSLGWQQIISPRISVKSSIGLQYKKINNAKWNYNSNNDLPFFVRDEIDKAIKEVNLDLEKLPTFFPTAMIVISYNFK